MESFLYLCMMSFTFYTLQVDGSNYCNPGVYYLAYVIVSMVDTFLVLFFLCIGCKILL